MFAIVCNDIFYLCNSLTWFQILINIQSKTMLQWVSAKIQLVNLVSYAPSSDCKRLFSSFGLTCKLLIYDKCFPAHVTTCT